VAGRRLYRSRTDRKIAGVCGGLAEYLGIDPVIPRILWVVLALGAGLGIIAYLICWIVIPEAPA
jgi:phage shock protein PspC (stress-responsive transcriptional regulator)